MKVGTLTAAAAFVYCLDSLILFRRFLASTFDLVIFDQGIRGYAHFAAPDLDRARRVRRGGRALPAAGGVNNIGPRLSGRDTVLLLDGTPRWAPWVVGDTLGLDFPFCTPSQQAQELAYLRAHGYSQVFADDGYVVLHRPADSRTAQALAHPLPAARLHTNICY